MNDRIIGVLGGKGPEATVELMNLIIRHTAVNREEDHARIIVDNNPKIPKASLAIAGNGPCPIQALVDTARNVEKGGADFLAIPCNSAHFYFKAICDAVTIPVLNIIDETVNALKHAAAEKVGLLATTGLLSSELYQKHLKEAGITPIVPDPTSQDTLMDSILHFKDSGEVAPLTDISVQVCRELIEQKGAEAVAYACTEIPLALAEHPPPCPAFNTIEVLAKACVRESAG